MPVTPGHRTTVAVTTSGSTTLVAFAQVTSITPAGPTRNDIETTHLGSDAREFIGTLNDGGELTFTIEYDPAAASHVEAITQINSTANQTLASQSKTFRVVTAATTGTENFNFSGYIKGFVPGELTVDGLFTAEITAKVSGLITRTYTT